MYLLAPFILQRGNPQAQNDTFALNNFFWYKPLLLLSSTSWPSSWCKIQKKSYWEFWECTGNYGGAPFLGSKWSICPSQFFFGKLSISISSTCQPLSWCKTFKKFFQQIQSYEDVQFLDPKWPISSNEKFFRKPVNGHCFFHLCLSTCQKSKSN